MYLHWLWMRSFIQIVFECWYTICVLEIRNENNTQLGLLRFLFAFLLEICLSFTHLFHQKGSCTRKQRSLWSASPSGYFCHNSFWCPKDPRHCVWETETHVQNQSHSLSDVILVQLLTYVWVATVMKHMRRMYTIRLQDTLHTFPDHFPDYYAPLHHRSCCLPLGMRSPRPHQQNSGRRELWCT